jgi:hypothetical protein
MYALFAWYNLRLITGQFELSELHICTRQFLGPGRAQQVFCISLDQMGFYSQISHGPDNRCITWLGYVLARISWYRNMKSTRGVVVPDSMNATWLHEYACSAVHSDCDVGFDRARMMGLCISLEIILSTELNNKVDRAVMLSVTSWDDASASVSNTGGAKASGRIEPWSRPRPGAMPLTGFFQSVQWHSCSACSTSRFSTSI